MLPTARRGVIGREMGDFMGNMLATKWESLVARFNAAPLLFTVFWIGLVAAIYCAILASRKARPLSRSHYFIAVVGINVIVLVVGIFAGAIDQGMAALGLDIGAYVGAAILIVAEYFLAYYSARRSRDIGWSPHCTWILLLPWIGYVMLVLLIVMPTKPQKYAAGKPAYRH
ncbi:MAG TPA: DUF805 domain-containing protein [Terriglobales bacterium]|nr:DUF805 domain-containing protein [Terriglobales bacterium]